MLKAIEQRYSDWPPDALHIERFAPKDLGPHGQDETFEVELAQSGITVTVPPDKTVLQAVEEAGVQVLSSCQEGTCGTCETVVLDGTVDHRDSLLTPAEQAAHDTMVICVSRAVCPRLALDLWRFDPAVLDGDTTRTGDQLDHEAAGVVESVREGVTEVAPGDRVILNWRAVCGRCPACRRGRSWYCFDTNNARQKMMLPDGTELSPAPGFGAFAEKVLVASGQCTKVGPAAAPATAGLLGCGVMAGLGTATSTGSLSRGGSVAVIGCGGVGSAAVVGARRSSGLSGRPRPAPKKWIPPACPTRPRSLDCLPKSPSNGDAVPTSRRSSDACTSRPCGRRRSFTSSSHSATTGTRWGVLNLTGQYS